MRYNAPGVCQEHSKGNKLKIDLVYGNIEDVILMETLVTHFGDEKFFEEVKPDVSTVDVVLTVNGKEIPFDKIIQQMAKMHSVIYDDAVVARALKLLNLAGLDDLKDSLQKARENVEMNLEKLLEKVGK